MTKLSIASLAFAATFIAVIWAVYLWNTVQARKRMGLDSLKIIKKGPFILNLLIPYYNLFTPILRRIKLNANRKKLGALISNANLSEIISVEMLWCYKATMVFVLFLLCLMFLGAHQVIIIFVFLIIGWFQPNLWLKAGAKKRLSEIEYYLPFFIDNLTLSVEAGLDFFSAMQRAARLQKRNELTDEINLMLSRIEKGLSRVDALRSFSERVRLKSVNSMVSLLVQASILGSPIGVVLKALAVRMRTERFQRAEKKGAEAAQKILIPLVIFIMPAVFIIIFGPIIIQFISGGFGL